MSDSFTIEELLITVLTRLLADARFIAVGASSPIPGSAALLAQELAGGGVRVNVLGSRDYNFFTDGQCELFDCAAQGRIDAFFLGGGQIDGEANLNLVGTGDYPATATRFPGSFGSAYLYFLVPNVILFREEHSPRVFVPKVDFISAPGVSPDHVYRPGGPRSLVTGKAVFAFERARPGFRLESVHPGHTLDEVIEATGFDFAHHDSVPATPEPPAAWLALLRGPIRERISETYPKFAASAPFENAAPAVAGAS